MATGGMMMMMVVISFVFVSSIVTVIVAYFLLQEEEDIDCVTSDWGDCDPTSLKRTRTVITKRSGKGKKCPDLVKACIPKPKDDDLSFTDKQMKFKHSEKCMDVAARATHEGAILQQWNCDVSDKSNQQFSYDLDTQRLKVKHSGKCVDISDTANEDGAYRLIQNTCNDSNSQKWIYDKTNNRFKSKKNNNNCIHVNPNSMDDRAGIYSYACTNGENEKFTFV